MSYRLALISDIHGNVTALRAVLDDAARLAVSEYWVLGDTFMPGPGTSEILDMLDRVNTTVFVCGNWEGALQDAMRGEIDLEDPTDVYLAVLSVYASAGLGDAGVTRATEWPMRVIKQLCGLTVMASHNLPDKSYGFDLATDAPPENFERLFDAGADIAVIGHTHAQILRPTTKGLVINPGSAGLPGWFGDDLRVHYAVLVISDQGVEQVDFRTVGFDVDAELELARQAELPYFDLYEEQLTTGMAHTHDVELLNQINQQSGYLSAARRFIRAR